MNDDYRPLLSAEETEALVQSWGYQPNQAPVDRFYPIRVCILGIAMLCLAGVMLFATESIAHGLSNFPEKIDNLKTYLYFRGWFLLIVLSIGLTAYIRGWYFGIVLSVFFIMGCMNFVSDLFTLYADHLKNPTPYFTLVLLLRLIALWLVYVCIKNVSRMPKRSDRFNVFLPFKRGV